MTTIFLAGEPVELSAMQDSLLMFLSEDNLFPRECADIKAKFLSYWELIVRERKNADNAALKDEIEAAGLVLADAIENRNRLRELVWKKVAKRQGIIGICGRCGAPIKRGQLKEQEPPQIVNINTGFYGFLGYGEEKTADHHDLNMIMWACEHCQEVFHVLAESQKHYISYTHLVNHRWPPLPMCGMLSRMSKIPRGIYFYEHQRQERVIHLPGIGCNLVWLK